MAKKFEAKLCFSEKMSGYISKRSKDCKDGEKKAKDEHYEAILDNIIIINDVQYFKSSKEHEATLEGNFSCLPFGHNMKIENGQFKLFVKDDETGDKEMVYSFLFTADDGKQYCFYGVKYINDKMYGFRSPTDPIKDMTTLFSKIYDGDPETADIVAAGIIRFHLNNLPNLIKSIKVTAVNRLIEKRAVLSFFGFVLGQLGVTYLPILFHDHTKMEDEYDAVVVGSGFGGSVAAYSLAKEGKSVCLLERGKHWRGNTNIKHLRDFYRMFRLPIHDGSFRNGLFEYRVFKKIQVLQANGVGGGSLIYANVILRPDADVFDKGWPKEININELKEYYGNVEEMLDVRKASVPPLKQLFPKTEALKQGATATPDGEWKLPNLAINKFETNEFGHCRELEKDSSTCRACGKCVLVCNRSAKNTLDLNYINEAINHGAELFAEHELTKITPINDGGSGYEIDFKDIRNNVEGKVKAKKLILSAGALGSTEILLKAKDGGQLPSISSKIGYNFSGNGDFLSFTVDSKVKTMSEIGPTITSLIDYQATLPGDKKFIVEEGGIPSPLASIANKLLPFLNKINNIAEIKDIIRNFMDSEKKDLSALIKNILQVSDGEAKSEFWDFIESFFSKPTDYTQMYLSMGRDASDGKIYLKDNGRIDIDWNPDASMPLFDEMEKKLAKISGDGLGGSYEPFPLWSLFKILVTVHPLGGCIMGNSVEDGVVNANGEVFNYPNLYVLDGSIIPKALGVNPALTIAALAERNSKIMLNSWE